MSLPLPVEDVRKIAVLRANAIGDFVVTLPALAALRQTYAAAEIVLLGAPWHAYFVRKGRSPIDRVIVVPVMQGIRKVEHQEPDELSVDDFMRSMRSEAFDIIVNFQGNGVSTNPFIDRMGARVTVGCASDSAMKPSRWIPYYYYQPEVARFLELVELIGARSTSLVPHLNVLPDDEIDAAPFSNRMGRKPYVIINPFANDPRRMWPRENFIVVANALSRWGYGIVVSGGPNDFSSAAEIVASVKGDCMNAAGISLGGLCALAANASLMISPDTGPLHLAQAVGCPTVGLYWAPNLLNWAPLVRGRHHPVVNWQMQCPLCGEVPNDPYPFLPKDKCQHETSFVQAISPDDVLNACTVLVNEDSPTQSSRRNRYQKKETSYAK